MKIVKHRKHNSEAVFFLFYEWKDSPGSGYSFPCDENGSPLLAQLTPTAAKKLSECELDPAMRFDGVHQEIRTWTDPAEGICRCGTRVVLESHTERCLGCGRLYNGCGQELNPPSMWEEDD